MWVLAVVIGCAITAGWIVSSIRNSMLWPDPKPRPYRCPDCQESFLVSDLLIMHVRAQHHEQFGPLKAKLEAVAKERKAKQKRGKRAKLKLVP